MNKLLTNYEQKKWANLSYLVAVVPTYDNGGYGFGEAKNDKRPNTPGLVNSRQNSFFCFLPFFPSSLLSTKKFDKTKILF